MRFRWMFPAAIAGIVAFSVTATVLAQGYPGYHGYPSYQVRQAPSDQMSVLPHYRVQQPMPPASYVPHPVVAPGYQAYGNSFDTRVETLPPGARLVPTPESPGWTTPTPAVPPDRLSQVEAELARLKSSIARGGYSRGGWGRSSYAPWQTGFYAGTAFVFAKPWFTDASNYGIYDAPLDYSTAGSFKYDYEIAPRVWLGYIGPNGRGFRARFWQFDHEGDRRNFTQTDPNIFYGADWIHPWGMITAMTTGVGDTMTITNSIKAQTLDLEVTQTLNFGWTEIMLGGGLRYAYLYKKFDADIPGVDFLIARQNFEGIGPTLSMDTRLPIDPCGCWALYGGCRYSILFGSSWAYGENGTDPFDYTLDEVLSIGEIEIGVEWKRPTAILGTMVFRAGYEAQVWYEAGSPSNVGGDLGFEGLSFQLGFIR